MQLENMVALVTGSAGGLGFAIANRFLEEGAHLVVNDINAEGAQAAGKRLLDARPSDTQEVLVLPADVADRIDEIGSVQRKEFSRDDFTIIFAGILGHPVCRYATVVIICCERVDLGSESLDTIG